VEKSRNLATSRAMTGKRQFCEAELLVGMSRLEAMPVFTDSIIRGKVVQSVGSVHSCPLYRF